MYDFGKPYGESCYRLMSRTGQFIYLRTRGFLDVDETTRQVHSFVCVNTLMSEDEGRQLIKDMKKKFSAIISEAELSALESDVPAVENPNKLERAILNLITNLNNQAMCGDDDPTMSDSSSVSEFVDKKPSLAIIAPEVNTIKSSIIKGVDVISHAIKVKGPTAKIKEEPKSPEPASVKMEPLSNVMSSPASSSSMSSADPLSPYSSTSSSNIPPTNTTTFNSRNSSITNFDENHQHNQSEQILHEATGAISVITSTGDSLIASNNNNNSRNSVLKRTHSKCDDDYSDEIIKKRVVNSSNNLIDTTSTTNTNFDILESSGAGKR